MAGLERPGRELILRCFQRYDAKLGTINAIDTLIDDIVTKLNERKRVLGLFFDLSSAFDTVNHSILLRKLEFYGIRGKAYNLIRNYLVNRNQYVELNNIECGTIGLSEPVRSKLVRVGRGVPQGSILGPILFVIFINDLVNYVCGSVPDCSVVVYADDTNAIISGSNMDELNKVTDKAILSFHKWFSSNNLSLNTKKTQMLIFKPNCKKNDKVAVTLNADYVASPVEHVKFLGIFIDSNLNWKRELAAVENSINSACYALRSLRDELSLDQLKVVYFSLVESKLRYSIKFWGNSFKYNINRAFVAQKRAIRTMSRIPPWSSCRDYFLKLGILTVPSLYIFILLTEFVKSQCKSVSHDDQESRLATRTKSIANSFYPKLRVVKHCARYQAVTLFNKLPTELKVITSCAVFKRKLKCFLLARSCYSIEEVFE